MIHRNTESTRAAADIATTTGMTVDLQKASSASVQVIYSDSAPAAKLYNGASAAVVDVDEDTIVLTAHGYITGTRVAATTAGTLPTGLSATNYFIIKVDANTVQLATSLANAVAGTAVDITALGVGNSTLTPSTSAGNVCKLQEGNDSSNWTDVSGATVTIATTTGLALWAYTGSSRYIRVLYTPATGQVNLAVNTCLVGTDR